MNVLSALSLVASAVYGALAAATLRRDPRAALNRVFALLCAAFGVWALGFAFMYSADSKEACWAWDRVASIGWTLYPPLSVHCALLLAGLRRWTDRPWLVAASYLPGLTIFIRYQLFHVGIDIDYVHLPLGWTPDVQAVSPWFWVYEAYVGASVGTSVAILSWWARTARLVRERRQARVVLVSAALTFTLGFGVDLGADPLLDLQLPPLAPVLALVFAGGTLFAMTRHRLMTLTPQTASGRILENVRDLLLLVDPEGRITDANPPALAALGYTRGQLVGAGLGPIVGGDEEARRILAATRDPSAADFPAEVRWHLRDGGEMPVWLWGSSVQDPDGDWIGAVLVGRDLSEQRRVEEGMQRASGVESIALLSAGLAHDFNNLMAGVVGNLELALEDARATPGLRDRIGEAARAAEQAHQLAQRLMSFHRGQSMARRDLDVGRLLAESAPVALRGSTVRLEVRSDPDLRPVRANEGQITQVVHNLLLNARQAMHDAGVLSIEAGNCDEPPEVPGSPLRPGPYVRITFRDQGPGLPPEVLARMFEPFFTTKPGGSGLGLPSSQSIVRRHGGVITAESPPGGGAIFRVFLPAR